MNKSKDGNLRGIMIRDPETLFVVAKFARDTRRSPNAAASIAILKALDRYRPKGDSIPPNQFWQGKTGAAQDAAAGEGADRGD